MPGTRALVFHASGQGLRGEGAGRQHCGKRPARIGSASTYRVPRLSSRRKMSLKQIAIIGVVFVVVGACGWFPRPIRAASCWACSSQSGSNFVHLATGVAASSPAFREKASIFFQIRRDLRIGRGAGVLLRRSAVARDRSNNTQTRCCTSSSPSSRSTSASA